MQTASLVHHPGTPSTAIDRIEVDIARLGDVALSLVYRVFGDLDRLELPEPAPMGRADGLWRHTCFEAFVRGPDSDYLELNFAPSLQWAAYRFTGYREGMRPAAIKPFSMNGLLRPEFEFHIELDIGRMARPDLPAPH